MVGLYRLVRHDDVHGWNITGAQDSAFINVVFFLVDGSGTVAVLGQTWMILVTE